MDNLFQLLIFLFVIYTIINSVFGKKKPQKRDREISQDSTDEIQSGTSPKPQYSSHEILQDLFGLKIPKTGGEYDTYPQNQYPSSLETNSSVGINQSEVEKTEMPNIDYDDLPSLEFQQNVSSTGESHSAYEITRSSNQKIAGLKKQLKDQKTLRELFLISEILNKPKALRK